MEEMLSAGTALAGVPSASRMVAWVKAPEKKDRKEDTARLVGPPRGLGTDICIRLRGGLVSIAAE